MAYTPPTGNSVVFPFFAPTYVAPAGNSVVFNFDGSPSGGGGGGGGGAPSRRRIFLAS